MRRLLLLRAVNVGGRKLSMAEARGALEELGFRNVTSVLQTGNVLLDAGSRSGDALERFVERELEKRLRLRADAFVRSAQEIDEIVARNPFPRHAIDDPARLHVVFLKAAPQAAAPAALRAAIRGREIVEAVGRQLYAHYPDGAGESKMTLSVIEKHLGVRGTARNWNTVLRLASLF